MGGTDEFAVTATSTLWKSRNQSPENDQREMSGGELSNRRKTVTDPDRRKPIDQSLLEEEERIAHTGGLARFAGRCARHPKRVIFGWLGVFIALIALNAAFHGKLINDFKIPGSDTQKATDLITAKFGGHKGAALRVVVAAPDGQKLDTPKREAAIKQMLAASRTSERDLAEDPSDISDITSPLESGSSQLSTSGQVAFFDVQYDRTGFELPRSGVVSVEDQLRAIAEPVGLQVEFTGEAESAPPTQGLSDIIGLVAAFIILMVLFRALVPTVIPLLFAITAVLGAFLILFLAARLTHFNTVTEILVPMIGLGVGIDYTLFIVTRFRQFLHDGLSPQAAAAAAGATAGRAVIFAGVTVAISITGLALIGLDFITKLGIGSALGVLDSGAALQSRCCPQCSRCSATRSTVGDSVYRASTSRGWARPGRRSQHGDASSRGTRRSRPAGHPDRAALARLARAQRSPRSGRRRYCAQGSDDAQGVRPPDDRFRLRVHRAHPGRGRHRSQTTRRRRSSSRRSGRCPGIRQVDKPIYNKKNRDNASVAIVNTYGKYKPQDPKTDDLVSSLRHTVIPRTLEGSSAHAYVSGSNAAFTDIGHRIFSHAPWFLLYIIGITFLVLAMAFRSAVIALKAALTTLLSALVGFGVLTLVVQQGHGMGLIGLDRTGPIESFVPPIAFAILFGLSTDYEVFLMSRIREEHVHGDDTVAAVKDGVAAVGRVIVAASLIMTSVFFSFLLSTDRVSKEFGLLLGVAILTDALLMRLTLVPALLTLLRERAWWIPGWLERILPGITIESPAERQPAPASPPRSRPADASAR